MYAVFIDRNKQYKVKEGQIVKLEKINLNIGDTIIFNQIILISNNEKTLIGTPNLKNYQIKGNIRSHGKYKKIKIFKFNRRKHYKKTMGHRQKYTEISIINIINTKIEKKNGT